MLPVPLDKAGRGRADAHNQVGLTFRMESTKVLGEWNFRVFVARTSRHERMLVEIEQPW